LLNARHGLSKDTLDLRKLVLLFSAFSGHDVESHDKPREIKWRMFHSGKGEGIGLRMQEGRKGGTEKKIKKAQFVENQERQTLVLKSAAFFTIIFFQSSC